MAEEIPKYLELSLSLDAAQRKNAEEQLLQFRNQPGYLDFLRKIFLDGNVSMVVRQSAAIQFKNTIKHIWVHSDETQRDPLSPEEREQIKSSILELALFTPPQIQKLFQESIVEIGLHDFPLNWPGLLPQIVETCKSLEHIVSALHIAHAVTKHYRNQFKSDEILIQLKAILESFQQPLLEIFMKMHQFVLENREKPEQVVYGFKALVYIAKIFFSLNFVDIPEFFEDHLKEWMTLFLAYLEFETNLDVLLEHPDDDDKPGLLFKLQAVICQSIGLFAEKYDVEFENYIGGFAQATWKLLTKVNQERKYDQLASQAIAFLSIACRGVNHKLFDNESAMRGICEQVIIPNMFFTQSDEEDFHENPIEYIRRDIEGSDSETRRRSSYVFVKGLRKYFESQVTNLLAGNITERLAHYATDPKGLWREKDVCTYLITALAVKGQTSSQGTTSTNDLVPIMDYFQSHVLPDLQAFPEGHPLLQADALKFSTNFRLQIPTEYYAPLLNIFSKMLSSPHYVVNTYAALAIERFLSVRNPDKSLRIGNNFKDFVPEILKNAFEVLKRNQRKGVSDHSCNENDYTMRCIMRVLFLLKEDVLPFVSICMKELTDILAEVSKNPQNPTFSHYLFESIAAVVKNIGKADPSKIQNFEQMLLPSFQTILAKDVLEYSPYTFQIMSLMLELTEGGTISPVYTSLFPKLLIPSLWERTGNIPGLVRLLQAYITKSKGSAEVLQFLEGILGVFQKLIGSKLHDHEGFYLLETIVQHLPWDAFEKYLPTIWNLLFLRLTKSKTGKFLRVFTIFISLFFAMHTPDNIIQSIDSVTSENPNLFGMVLKNVWISNVHTVSGLMERKICSVGMTKLLSNSTIIVDKYFELWGETLTASLKLIFGDEEARPDEDIFEAEDTPGYKANFSRLAYGAKEDVDPFPDVDKGGFLAHNLCDLSKRNPGKIGGVVQQALDPTGLEALVSLFQKAGIREPYFV